VAVKGRQENKPIGIGNFAMDMIDTTPLTPFHLSNLNHILLNNVIKANFKRWQKKIEFYYLSDCPVDSGNISQP